MVKSKILHINYIDIEGGAARATYRLHIAMFKAGIDSNYLVQNLKGSSYPKISFLKENNMFILKLLRLFVSKLGLNKVSPTKKDYGLFSYTRYGHDLSKNPLVCSADIIYLHWINSGFLSLNDIENILKLGKPVFWFMHDMFPITGGCHYSFECNKYEALCHNCPCFELVKDKDLAFYQFLQKENIFLKYNNLSFIAPSQWLAACAKRSKLAQNKNVFNVPNLFDVNLFKPIDKKIACNILNINHEKKIILFGAQAATNNPYKGWAYLQQAMQILKTQYYSENIEVIVFGSDYNEDTVRAIPYPINFLGRLYDDYSLALLYSAADLFVAPSLADNFPNTILESLACGTPVVGFNIGGIPDLIDNTCGYLAKYNDPVDLAKGIITVLSAKQDLGKAARAKSLQFSEKNIIAKHKSLWKSLR